MRTRLIWITISNEIENTIKCRNIESKNRLIFFSMFFFSWRDMMCKNSFDSHKCHNILWRFTLFLFFLGREFFHWTFSEIFFFFYSIDNDHHWHKTIGCYTTPFFLFHFKLNFDVCIKFDRNMNCIGFQIERCVCGFLSISVELCD